MSSRARTRTGPEWVTFAVSCGVLAALVAAIGWLWVRDEDPARMEVRTVQVEPVDAEQIEVSVEVVNRGDRAAVAVQVIAEIEAPDGPEPFGEQTIDFLSGGETATLVFLAPTTDASSVTVRVGGFSVP